MTSSVTSPILQPVPYYPTRNNLAEATLGIALLTVAAIGTAIVLNKQGICSLRARQIVVVASLGLGPTAIIATLKLGRMLRTRARQIINANVKHLREAKEAVKQRHERCTHAMKWGKIKNCSKVPEDKTALEALLDADIEVLNQQLLFTRSFYT